MQDLVVKVHSGHATTYDLDEMRKLGKLMQVACHCGLGQTAPNPILDSLEQFPEVYAQRLRTTNYEPAFDLNAALEDARQLTGRTDAGAYLHQEELFLLGAMP